MEKPADMITGNIEVVPVVVLSQTFPARLVLMTTRPVSGPSRKFPW